MPLNMNLVSLFLRADVVVQAVMILLVLASITCWSILISKLIIFKTLRVEVRHFEDSMLSNTPIQTAGLAQSIHHSAMRASEDKDSSESRNDRRERIQRAMLNVTLLTLKQRERGLAFLATVGSSGSFVGLFGTVWGIMNSFISIAASHETSLDVVAPGIAEALLATAFGLLASIPAVIAYNALASNLRNTAFRFEIAIGQLAEQLSVFSPSAAISISSGSQIRRVS